MSKRVSKAASLELAFLGALDRIHADVDTSEIGEIQDWSRAVRGKFHGAVVKDASDPNATNEPVSSSRGVSGVVLGTSSSTATHGNVQYSELAIPQLIAVCTSEPSEEAWSEFVRRFQRFIATVIAKVARRFGKFSPELVDDLTQETFLKLCDANFRVLKGVETRHENALLGFLRVIAANTAMDHFRSLTSFAIGSRTTSEADRVFAKFAFSRGTSTEPERKIFLEEIDRALKALSHQPNFERDYKIFWLYYSNGLTAKEISALPGIKLSIRGVESTLLRLTRQISSALG